MTSISTQLSSLFSGSNSTLTNSATLTQSLADALSAADNASSDDSGDDSSNNAYSLNLSPAAQNLLNASGSSSTGSASSTTSTNFTLSKTQQQTIQTILEKYKNAPYDQATFDSIKSDLAAAGLGTNTLALKDEVSSFNPTSEFLSALSGTTPNLNSTASGVNSSAEQTKAQNYLQGILTAFQSISTDYAAQKSGASVTA